jgi:16S rRNA C1402 (ribose-2'-O) methylase RsmI
VTIEILVAEFLRAQAAWRLARAEVDPVRAARCAAALLDAGAFVATLTADDEDLAALAEAGCFCGNVFDPGAQGVQIARWWQFGDPPFAGPRDLLAALSAAVGRPVARSGPAAP